MEVLVSAWVGSSNLGDELVFAGLRHRLVALGAAVTAVSVSASATRSAHGVAAIDHRNVLGLLRASRRVDAVIFGGGGLVQNQTSDLNLAYHLGRLVPARLARTPLGVVGIGAGPLHGRLARGLPKAVLRRAQVCTARDPASAALLRGIGLSSVEVAADLALSLPLPEVGVEDRLVVCLRPWSVRRGRLPVAQGRAGEVAPWFVEEAAGALDDAAAATGLAVRFVALQADRDGPLHDQVAERMSSPVTTVCPGLDDVVAEVARGTVVVAMRYHALVAAVLGARPAVTLGYDPKVDWLAADIGAGVMARRADQEGVGGLADAVEALAGSRREKAATAMVEARAHLRKREQRNGAALERLLSD